MQDLILITEKLTLALIYGTDKQLNTSVNIYFYLYSSKTYLNYAAVQ